MSEHARRHFLGTLGAGAAALGLSLAGCATDLLPKSQRRVIVVGGGFGGLIAARTVRQLDPGIDVVLIERHRQYVACPFSNRVITGLRTLDELTLGYDALAARHGVRAIFDDVIAVDADAKTVFTPAGKLRYDRLILAPGIDFRHDAIAGYDPLTTPAQLPHAWRAGAQTLLLKRQLETLPDGGRVVISIPLAPFRCPPGPYERACLIAAWMKRHRPRAKLIVLDANPDIIAMAPLFRRAWDTRYPGIIDYQPAMRVTEVDGANKAVLVEGIEAVRGDVVNLIPPQQAGAIAMQAGLAEPGAHWCAVDPVTFESTRRRHIHVIGDAAIAGAMPKSAYSANAQAKICAINTVALMNGHAPQTLAGINACYGAIGEDEEISIAQVFTVADGRIVAVPGTNGTSPADLSNARREHRYAESWLRNILAEMAA